MSEATTANHAPQGACLVLIEQLVVGSQNKHDCQTATRPYLFGFKRGEKRVIVYRPDCKMWSCAFCADRNKRYWSARIAYASHLSVDEGRDLSFITITANPKHTAERAFAMFPAQWNKLYSRMKRLDANFRYALIPELHESGKPHWHMLTDFINPPEYTYSRKKRANTEVRVNRKVERTMPKLWKDIPAQCGLGYMNDMQRLDENIDKAVGYVAKYIAKSTQQGGLPEGVRRVRVSVGYPELPDLSAHDKDIEWITCHTKADAEYVLSKAQTMEYAIVNARTGEIALAEQQEYIIDDDVLNRAVGRKRGKLEHGDFKR